MIARLFQVMLRRRGPRSAYRNLNPARVSCRAATEADAAAVARLIEPLFPPAARSEALPTAERLLSETMNENGEYRIAEMRGFIVAGCQVGPLLRSAGFEGDWILGLWVHPLARGRGIGESLIRNVIETAGKAGKTRLFCHIASTNTASLGLFRKLGFADADPELQARIHDRFSSGFSQECEVHALCLELVSKPA